jgi:hypothetical protein
MMLSVDEVDANRCPAIAPPHIARKLPMAEARAITPDARAIASSRIASPLTGARSVADRAHACRSNLSLSLAPKVLVANVLGLGLPVPRAGFYPTSKQRLSSIMD